MKKKNGFTLIELLAIIVILAIIAVITVPIILNIIETAREGAAKNSVTGYGKAVELAFTEYQYQSELDGTTPSKKDGDKTIKLTVDGSEIELTVNYEGDDVTCTGKDGESESKTAGTITDGKLVLENCTVGKYGPFKYEKGVASKAE